MVQLFGEIRVRFGEMAPVAPSPPDWAPRLPSFDGAPELIAIDDPNAVPVGDAIRGLTIILNYIDAEGAESTRQVSCSRLICEYGSLYLRAFCHQRRAPRKFRTDRIAGVYDAVTGEHLGPGGDYFAAYLADRVGDGAGEWGLLPGQRSALGAALIVLTFLSRCDGQCHRLESEEIDTFVAGWWMRAEIDAPFPEQDVAARVRRLAPDVEAFELAANHVKYDRTLRPIVSGYARRLVAADQRIAAQEQGWIGRLIEWWEEG